MSGDDQARLAGELRASRARLAVAADDERLRLERELHDGAQQRLMALQIKLSLLHEDVSEPALAAALDELAGDAEAAVADLRALAHGIYPTVLRERGLGDALRSLARTCPLTVDVADEGIGRCATAVESAIYRCVAEAIGSVASPGARVAVTLGRRGTDATFAVVVDAAGLDPGLVRMRDRIGAVGGDVEIASAPGQGRTVRGSAPVTGPPTDG